jgi:glycosyltransferase involved in cell wall biosynthesis
MVSRRKKILVVGMADSIHLARWLTQFSQSPIDFELFPSSPHRRLHTKIKSLTSASDQLMTLKIQPSVMRWLALPLSALDIIFRDFFRARLLRRTIVNGDFDIIHVLELQHAGYLLLATRLKTDLPTVFVTNWGSDIYWYQRFPGHQSRIREILQIADVYSAECRRDIELVQQLGYSGKIQPIIPNSGGIDIGRLAEYARPPSKRLRVMVKGYTGFVGQALTALRACELAAPYLRDYEIILYSASLKSRLFAMKLRLRCGLKITVLKKRTPHAEMLRYFSESRVYLGVSLSDGISTSLLESMATGCYPIQTQTSCADEWIRGDSGSLIPHDDVELIANELICALSDNAKVDRASRINGSTIQERGSSSIVASVVADFYELD